MYILYSSFSLYPTAIFILTNQLLVTRIMDSAGIGIPSLQFNPDKHPHATLKAFNDFIEQFEFRYNAQYPEPSRSVMENAISKWKALNNEREPVEKHIKIMQNEWISKDKVRKLLGFFSSSRLQLDWKAVEPNPETFDKMLNGTIFLRQWDYIINLRRIKLYEILNSEKMLSYQTNYLVHFATTLKLQEKLVRFVTVKKLQSREMCNTGPNSHR